MALGGKRMLNKIIKTFLNPCINFIIMCIYIKIINTYFNYSFVTQNIFVYFICSVAINAGTFFYMLTNSKKKWICIFNSVIIYFLITMLYMVLLMATGTGGTPFDDEGFGEGLNIIIVYMQSIKSLIVGNLLALIIFIIHSIIRNKNA